MSRSHLLAAAALATFLVTPGICQTRDLTFRDRVEAQRAIERVYYSHQTGATLPFDEEVPTELLERKVRTTLKQSVALEKFWKTPIKAAMLDAEIERMRRTTRMPVRLNELFAALNYDRLLIRECLARPLLVRRLLESFYSSDPRLHGEARARAEKIRGELEAKRGDVRLPEASLLEVRLGAPEMEGSPGAAPAEDSDSEGPVRLTVSEQEFRDWRRRLPSGPGGVGAIVEEQDRFTVPVLLEEHADRLLIATRITPKRSREEWWSKVEPELDESLVQPLTTMESVPETVVPCNPDLWEPLDFNVPSPRSGFTAVWTGSWMIVWGGSSGGTLTNSGAVYEPATDHWVPTSLNGAPTPRSGHVAVWAGDRMVVWSGSTTNTGGRYQPASDTWQANSTFGAPEGRSFATAVWTGSRMVVWGGSLVSGFSNTGGRYDPVANTWTAISLANAPAARSMHSAVWTGSRMVVWGGLGPDFLNDGGRYDPASDSWQSTSMTNPPSPRFDHTAVWTGGSMIVWGGNSGTAALQTGGRYDAASDQWAPVSLGGAPEARSSHSAVWTGNRMMVWGGSGPASELDTGGRYDPTTDSWESMSTVGAPAPRTTHRALWTGALMVVWGGQDSNSSLNTGGRYDPVTDSWTPTRNVGGAPSARSGHSAIWTGSQMVVWGGRSPSDAVNTGGIYDPATGNWTPTALTGAPSARSDSPSVWTGDRMVIWGGAAGATVFGDGALYNPIADSWEPTSTVNAPSPRAEHTAAWSGSSVIVWGGKGVGGAPTDTGGRLDPVANTWTPTSMTVAPEARRLHTAVWTGSLMVVWGGRGTTSVLGTGSRYDPAADSWSPTTTTGAPGARKQHTAVWTGSQMIVSGGDNEGTPFPPSCTTNVGTGGIYDPNVDNWSAIGGTGRIRHSAVWTGHQMVIWGGLWNHHLGQNDDSCWEPVVTSLGTGLIYTPSLGDWTQLSGNAPPFGNAPSPRSAHSAVWTGDTMLVWGGEFFYPPPIYGISTFQDGGQLAMVPDADSDGFSPCEGDCDDTLANVFPGAPESCDGLDNDCDGTTDEGLPDGDGDGYSSCFDCNDADPAINPGAAEICNGADENCSGTVDEGFPDQDEDGYANCLDCQDLDPSIFPGATEVCNQLDDDCDTLTDEGFDQDADGITSCEGDCNDADPGDWYPPLEVTDLLVNPGTPTSIEWFELGPYLGPGMTYDLTSGPLTGMAGLNLPAAVCLQSMGGNPYSDTRGDPAISGGYWYLARARNSCGIATYGYDGAGFERSIPACP